MKMDRRDFMMKAFWLSVAAQAPSAFSPLLAQEKSVPALKAKIPSSGETLLRVGLGTYRTFDIRGDRGKRKELAAVLKAFVDRGGTLLDTSPMYGSAETAVGELAEETGVNEKLFLATKVWTEGRGRGIEQMNQSLKLLKRKKIELMQIHNLLDWKTHLPTLREWKEQGRIQYIGLTHYTADAFGELERIIVREPIDFLQIPYSMRDTSAEKSLIPAAARKGVAVIANEPFGAGTLFGPTKGKPVPAWAQEIGITSWAQFFLKYILAVNDIQFAIPATGSVAHLLDNMKAAYGTLPTPAQRERMRKDFAAL